MSFGNQTPEAFLTRSDSRDPATTCKGITTAGRPCRRALAASTSGFLATSPDSREYGVVAVLNEGDAAAFFCWQHKDQADLLLAKYSQHTEVLPLKEKSSIDTLMERIGVLEINDEVGDREARTPAQKVSYKPDQRHSRHERLGSRNRLPQEWQRVQGPLMSVPRDVVQSQSHGRSRQYTQSPGVRPRSRPDRVGRSNVKASWGCCVRIDEDDMPPPRRRDERPQRTRTRRDMETREARSPSRSRQRREDVRGESAAQMSRPVSENAISPITSHYLPLSEAEIEEVFVKLMYRRGWQNLPHTARMQMQSYSPKEKWDVIEQDRLAERRSNHVRSSSDLVEGESLPHIPRHTVAPRYATVDIPEIQLRQPQPIQNTRSEYTSNNPMLTPTRQQLNSQPATSPPNAQTASFLSLIPLHLSPTTTSALLSELSKPISQADEAGYIYIFWLTPDSDALKPDDETAASILDPDEFSPNLSPSRPGPSSARERRESEIGRRQTSNLLTAQALQRFASIRHSPAAPKKILLKIGRASNVYRRLSQWTKQCGQNITLIRYYPYDARGSGLGSSGTADPDQKKTVPHVHRVERLIHLELADQRVANKGKCEQCGREHKEWFEVEATRDGVKAVDEVIRRWVSWAQAR